MKSEFSIKQLLGLSFLMSGLWAMCERFGSLSRWLSSKGVPPLPFHMIWGIDMGVCMVMALLFGSRLSENRLHSILFVMVLLCLGPLPWVGDSSGVKLNSHDYNLISITFQLLAVFVGFVLDKVVDHGEQRIATAREGERGND